MNNKAPNPGNDNVSPTMPLTDYERAIWNAWALELVDLGIAGDSDSHALTTLVQQEAIRREALAQLRRFRRGIAVADDGDVEIVSPLPDDDQSKDTHGLLGFGSTGQLVVNPLLKVFNDAHDRVHRLLIDFGMTPAARDRITRLEDGSEEKPKGFAGLDD